MRSNRMSKLVNMALAILLLGGAGAGQETRARNPRRADRESQKSTSGAAINLARLPENPSHVSLTVSDGDESVVSATFTVEQLRLVRDIMSEARKFAFSDESVGTSEPITTRFSNSKERALVVDVQKFGNQSSLYLTLKTDNGRMTVEAGTISRSDRKETGPFFDALARIESAVGKRGLH
ncbi:MAG TPA: hypothetical protein VJH03_23750 [Blastocatellia bacterium]|nr:hypothetical protein [Blastocatellia bacterium]